MQKDLAAEVMSCCLNYSADLNQLLWRIKAECSVEEFEFFRKGVGQVMGYGYTDLMRPICLEHPDLEPDGWKTSRP